MISRNWRWLLCLVLFPLLSACSIIDPADTRSGWQQWHDTQIEMEVGGLANKPPFNGQTRVNAVSVEGKVLLVGQAVNQGISEQLEQQVRAIPNVSWVYNELQIRPLPQLGEVSQDSWITTKVKSQLIASKRLRDISIKVITEGQAVYLLGYVTAEQGDVAADITRNVSGVKKVVKVFEYPQP
ncbi:BON domain-containing protein [Photobacterium aphoticum]|uniref:Hemolysin n=1 Tax=Photobacterium aphoticum TaxID=754436 RepID=A0A0J1GSJ5_9GAMM|nr:BON domain-containing protein [Photobacterium aphoticum]KLV02680.1 hemolysin [Photobacterium aphoticum]PSU55349.1 BON domain-containing protein [Photobacterium aphoticum]GHA54199.1 hemolysin [Photobacterium aphoticum]